ncbi:MAG: hypothetical protein A4E62_02141 [Syntrophorhabdus sp. PtaU1.Bin002]|nr:MAG: hypothetical protein A4E62_02141 [Syntrophorhabdus sp. PtaU1.Bin002]
MTKAYFKSTLTKPTVTWLCDEDLAAEINNKQKEVGNRTPSSCAG